MYTARSEKLVRFIIGNSGNFVCKARSPENGLLIGNSLVSSDNDGIGMVSIINSDVTNKFINTIDLDLEPLSNYHIVDSDKECPDEYTNNVKERRDVLLNKIKLDHLNKEESTVIIEILDKYINLFTLEGDVLTCCDAVQHQIPLLTD